MLIQQRRRKARERHHIPSVTQLVTSPGTQSSAASATRGFKSWICAGLSSLLYCWSWISRNLSSLEAGNMIFSLLCCFQHPKSENALSIRQSCWWHLGKGFSFCAWRPTKPFSIHTLLECHAYNRSLLVTMNYCQLRSWRSRHWQNLFPSFMFLADICHFALFPLLKKIVHETFSFLYIVCVCVGCVWGRGGGGGWFGCIWMKQGEKMLDEMTLRFQHH